MSRTLTIVLAAVLLIGVPLSDPAVVEAASLKDQIDSGEEREAMFMGLGDIIIPGALVVSAQVFLMPMPWLFGITTNVAVGLTTLIGSLLGFVALMVFVLRGKPQAGLPLLNGGAIGGYFFGAGLLYPAFGLAAITTTFTPPGLF